MRDNGKRTLEQLVEVHDIDVPAIAGFKSPNETPSPPMEPFKLFEDDRVRVSATLVDHAPVWPAASFDQLMPYSPTSLLITSPNNSQRSPLNFLS
jgi:hypothetical protein